MTGAEIAALEPFDRLMQTFVAQNKIPGAALAVSNKSKLVYARGFGFAEVEHKKQVEPNSIFRIASVSKPITAVAILQLVEQQKLGLDDHVVDRLKLTGAEVELLKDPRWRQITVRQCLQHTGGWDREKAFDPIARPAAIAGTLHTQTPVPPADIVRYMLGRNLEFDPGSRYSYSNLGYLILGRILENVSHEKYETFVRKHVLSPLGIKSAVLGRALPEHRHNGEVHYYDTRNRTGPCLYPPHRGKAVPLPYGAENFESFEAHGGWTASAIDLVRFADAFNLPDLCPILKDTTIGQMWARPEGLAGHDTAGKPTDMYYGCGWNIRPVGNAGKSNTWHGGYIAGTSAFLVRRWDDKNWAVLFNTNDNPAGKSLFSLIDSRVHEAADSVKAWPDIDRYPEFIY
jgi:N-acyl-D-amino-acid deacylase